MFPASFASSWLIKHGGPKGRRARASLPCTIFCQAVRKLRPSQRESGRLSRPGNPSKTDPHQSGSPRSTINAKKTKTALPLCQNCGPRSFRNPSPVRQGDSTASAQVSREVYCWVKSLDLWQWPQNPGGGAAPGDPQGDVAASEAGVRRIGQVPPGRRSPAVGGKWCLGPESNQ